MWQQEAAVIRFIIIILKITINESNQYIRQSYGKTNRKEQYGRQ